MHDGEERRIFKSYILDHLLPEIVVEFIHVQMSWCVFDLGFFDSSNSLKSISTFLFAFCGG